MTPTRDITIAPIATEDDFEGVRGLVREFFAFAATLDSKAQDAATFSGLEKELANLPGRYGPPGGVFLLVRVDGAPMGCGAFFELAADAVEIKRMYVRPEARGLSIGRLIVDGLMDHARALGKTRVALSTFHKLDAAIGLYESAGFERCAPTEDLPPGYEDKVIFMERDV